MKKFLKGLLMLILLTVIVGGIGYIGYNYLFMNPMQSSNGAINNEQAAQAPADTNSMQGMSGMPGMPGMEPAKNTAAGGTQAAEIAGLALKNRDGLNQALSSLNEAIEFMSMDPYGSSQKTPENNSMADMPGMSNMPAAPESNQAVTNPGTATPAPSVQGNTTINIYPQSDGGQGTPANSTMQNGMMPADMGTTYDPSKMEQLHSGLFKLSLGMQLLEQLAGEFASQAESAASNVQDIAQYYSLQYTTTLQNKSKLNQASIYINEAANLVNINPYISSNGMVFDQERMQQIHKSVFKLADGVASLSRLDDDLTRQAVAAANAAQGYMNAANTSQMNMVAPATGVLDSLFDGLSAQFIINAILVVFVTAFILGILGFTFSLLKSPAKNQQI